MRSGQILRTDDTTALNVKVPPVRSADVALKFTSSLFVAGHNR